MSALICVGLGFALIPVRGPAGAASASVLAEVSAIGLAVVRVHRVLGHIHLPKPRRVIGALVASLVTVAALLVSADASWIVRAALGIVVSFAVAVALGAIRRSDLSTPT